MDEVSLNWYGDSMRKLGVQSLFQVNRDAVRDPYDMPIDEYPFAADFQTQSRQVVETASIRNPDMPGYSADVNIVLALAHRRT